MIGRIRVRGFKSVHDETISFGRLNVLIGANGSGKGAVLEAIGVAGAAAEGRVDDTSLMRRGVRPGVPDLYRTAFADVRVPRFIRVRVESDDDPPAQYNWAGNVTAVQPTPDLLSPSVPVSRQVVRFVDRYMKRGRNKLSGYDASEGALYVLFVLALIFHPRAPRFFAVEIVVQVDASIRRLPEVRKALRAVPELGRFVEKVHDRERRSRARNPIQDGAR
ncbi:MAG: AAA family ATPase [Myxococcota bacterium]|nr:AAA family ATPase [Myxococcota bacterium]